MLKILIGCHSRVVLRLCHLTKLLSKNRVVAPQSTMAAVAMLCLLPLIFTWIWKWDALGSISKIVDILHDRSESYEEVAYIANCSKGALSAAETGTLIKNPPGGVHLGP